MIANGNTYCRVITPILPPEYQEVEYIQSSGTQYIDTGISCNNDTGIEADIQQVSYNTNNWSVWIGSLKTTSDGNWVHLGQASRDRGLRFSWGVGSGTFVYTSISSSDFNRHTYKIDKGELTIDNTTTYTLTNSYEFTTSPSTIVLFADKKGSTITEYSSIKIFYCKLYDNNVLIRNLIPCYRKSDNVIGMYDTVNKVFYTNQGTGTFLKGNNVVHTIKYKIPTEERPYISGHVTDNSSTITFKINNQYITTNVDNNGNFKWYVDRTISDLNGLFQNVSNVDYVKINFDLVNIRLMYSFRGTLSMNKIELKNIYTTNANVDIRSLFNTCNFNTFNVSNIILDSSTLIANSFKSSTNLVNININKNNASFAFDYSLNLSKQSVLNLINAAVANVTYTLHSTVYNKCASGGEWYTDIQSAIDAKALEGYTVTLISA